VEYYSRKRLVPFKDPSDLQRYLAEKGETIFLLEEESLPEFEAASGRRPKVVLKERVGDVRMMVLSIEDRAGKSRRAWKAQPFHRKTNDENRSIRSHEDRSGRRHGRHLALSLLHRDACTVNAAINLHAKVTIETRRDAAIRIRSIDRRITSEAGSIGELDRIDARLSLIKGILGYFEPSTGFDLTTDCCSPDGAGLGGSSALGVALVGALNALTGRG